MPRGGSREGSGRKVLGEKKRIQRSITLPPELYVRLEEYCGITGKLVSDVMIEALQAFLNKQKDVK